MTLPRRQLVCLQQTSYYHCTSRCVRRAFLCGKDNLTGRDFSHRRHWIESRLSELAGIFSIDILAYALMSNHYHLVMRIDERRARNWSDEEVESRWGAIFRLPIAYQTARIRTENQAAQEVVRRYTACWRSRLMDIGWLMRCINEPLARLANREDGVRGRFWEGRYRSQALLDTAAVLKCMAYVDLNPVRAGIARTPEASMFTSFRRRVEGRDSQLAPFVDTCVGRSITAIPYRQQEYWELVDWTGRMLRSDGKVAIDSNAPPICERLGLSPKTWISHVQEQRTFRSVAMGSIQRILEYREHLKLGWIVPTPAAARPP